MREKLRQKIKGKGDWKEEVKRARLGKGGGGGQRSRELKLDPPS